MEYESKYERVKSDNKEGKQEKLDPEKRQKIEWMTQEGHTQKEIAEEVKVSSHTVVAVRQQMGDSDIDIGSYKKQTADLFKKIVMKGAHRLNTEIDDIPIGMMPVSLAILIDKIAVLQDQPTVIVENRLKISHEHLNKMLEGEIIDLPDEK
jgi:hypothetical protein